MFAGSELYVCDMLFRDPGRRCFKIQRTPTIKNDYAKCKELRYQANVSR